MKKLVRFVILGLVLVGAIAYPKLEKSLSEFRQAQVRKQLTAQLKRDSAENAAVIQDGEARFGQRFYYQQLNTEEKADYIRIVESFENFAPTVETRIRDTDTLSKIYLAVAYDFPDFYWLTETSELDLSYHRYPAGVKDTYQELQALADQVIAGMPDGSDYDKVKYLYEFIIHQTDYHTEALENDELAYQSQSMRSVLVDRLSVCAGYSRAFQFLCQKAGIESIYVVGDIAAYEEDHAWNLVQIDGQYYPVDVTWGDPVFESRVADQPMETINYAYLCTPKTIFEATHKPWGSFWQAAGQEITYPDIADTGYNYFALQGNYFEDYSQEVLGARIAQQLGQTSQDTVEVQFANGEFFKAAVADLEAQDSYLHHYLMGLPHYQGFEFRYDDYTYVISVKLIGA
ncbi:hypothetical protein ABID29_000119 [Streptococcus rupicaprae]|uniref:Transglutaminase-like domain-containing protein n=1 Tax=Streptococcus rupicaprae TaxID=759619 RepID=A0ABV2FEM2_9STRE